MYSKKRCKICGMRTYKKIEHKGDMVSCCEVCEGKFGTTSRRLIEELNKGRFK